MSRKANQADIGTKVIGVRTVGDMLFKLHWELMQLAIAQSKSRKGLSAVTAATYGAFNSAVTAWHVVDWAWAALSREQKKLVCPTGKVDEFKKGLILDCPELGICQALTNNGKHAIATYGPSLKVREIIGMHSVPVGQLRAGDPIRTIQHEIYLSDGGVEQPAIVVFRKVARFLQERLLKLGLLDDLWKVASFFDEPAASH